MCLENIPEADSNEESTYHRILIGPPGSGKSFLVAVSLGQHPRDKHRKVIIDTRGSSQRLADLLEGKYLTYQSWRIHPKPLNPNQHVPRKSKKTQFH